MKFGKNNKEDNMNGTTVTIALINNGTMLMSYSNYHSMIDSITSNLKDISQGFHEWVRYKYGNFGNDSFISNIKKIKLHLFETLKYIFLEEH